MNPTYEFDDHVALVTGAAGGMGLDTARAFAAAGAAVVLADIDGDAAHSAADELKDAGYELEQREDVDETGERLGVRGNEFGTVTGRKRRCGWFDAVLGRYAARLNGLTELFVTKLDVLSGFERVRICTGYRADGALYDDFPPHQSLFHKAEPVYEELDGWMEEIDEATSFEDLPKEARTYVHRLEELVGVSVSVVSIGPAREQSLPVG